MEDDQDQFRTESVRVQEQTMQITEAARRYVAANSLARTPIYSADRFARVLSDLPLEAITTDTLQDFATRAKTRWKPWTVRCTIKDVCTVLRASGYAVKPARVRVPPPTPEPVALPALDAIWSNAHGWLRQWMVVAYWTGARLDDTIRIQQGLSGGDVISLTAGKTGHRHRWPVPEWIRFHLQPVRLPYTANSDWCGAIVRGAITLACRSAGIDRVTPSQIRDRSLNEWARASPQAVAIIHGSGLGVLSHYLDPFTVLETAAARVRVPACFGSPAASHEDSLLTTYRRLDPQAQDLVRGMSERLIG